MASGSPLRPPRPKVSSEPAAARCATPGVRRAAAAAIAPSWQSGLARDSAVRRNRFGWRGIVVLWPPGVHVAQSRRYELEAVEEPRDLLPGSQRLRSGYPLVVPALRLGLRGVDVDSRMGQRQVAA